MTMQDKDELVIFDTTLRDGEQSPGVTLTEDCKVIIAKQLSKLGVTVCEAGFPIASEGDFKAVQRIAREVGPLTTGRPSEKPMVICGLARCTRKDIARAYDAIKDAPLHRIHTFLATSDIHLEHKLKISRERCLELIEEHVTYAKSLCEDLEFSPEDAGRSDKEFLAKACGVAIRAGATTLNIPDTVGFVLPSSYGNLIDYLCKNTPGYDPNKVRFSTHCHNDLGMATANTLSGVLNGARQVEVTINGIGERAGNTSLEEVVMAIRVHPKKFPVHTNIHSALLLKTSQMVSIYTGMYVQKNKAIVGANAFAHESGIHQDGMLKNADTYEIMRPEDVGSTKTRLVLGKHSGRAALKSRLSDIGYDSIHDDVLNNVFVSFKQLCDSGRNNIKSDELHALVKKSLNNTGLGLTTQESKSKFPVMYTLKDFDVRRDNTGKIFARVALLDMNGNVSEQESTNMVGPVMAIFDAILKCTEVPLELLDYEIRCINKGSSAMGQAIVHVCIEEQRDCFFVGQDIAQDILKASAQAFINSINNYFLLHKSKDHIAEIKTGLI